MEQHASIVTFGELLLRLDTPGSERFVQAGELKVSFTGGEANVAVNLRQWNRATRIVSRVPEHEIGEACCNHFRRYGVDTGCVLRGGERLGLFYVESGLSHRSSKVIYDRDHTAFRDLDPEQIDWETALDGACWLHFTGTAPAGGENVRQALREGIAAAKAKSIPISFDCAYRATLWSEQEAASILPEFLHGADLFIGSEYDATTFFGIAGKGQAGMAELCERYNVGTVAYTSRRVEPSGVHDYASQALAGEEFAEVPEQATAVVDRIGTGDAFVAGLIHSRLNRRSLSESLQFATAAALLKHTIPGDLALLSEEEIEHLARGNSHNGVRR